MLKKTNKKSNWPNRDRPLTDFRPEKMAKVEDFEKPKKQLKEVTFNTNLKITNHARNMLQSLVTLGYTSTQKDAIELLYQAFTDQLDDDSKKELDMQYRTLEKRDTRLKNKHLNLKN